MRSFLFALHVALAGAAPVFGAPPARRWLAAFGKADITPDLAREKTYLAGYGAAGRRPRGVESPLWARALMLSDGKYRLVLLAVDSIGLFREDVEALRREAGYLGPGRYLLVAATHSHAAPDTMGLWGPFPGVSGVDAGYRRRLRESAARLVRDLEGRLEPVELKAARVELDPRGLCRDGRDPAVLDPELNVLEARVRGRVLGTALRWSCHPEVLGRENRLLSPDFPGAACRAIERETGGACVYFSGSVGGHMRPDVSRPMSPERELAEMRRIGEALARAAFGAAAKAERVPAAEIRVSSRVVLLPVENSRYLIFLPSLAFGHRILDGGGRPLAPSALYRIPLRHVLFFPLKEEARPWVETEAVLARAGGLAFLGVPGELSPELALGGYDGRYAYGSPLVRADNPNPPDLSRAPKGPYLRERLGEHGWVLGLANDAVGYILPEYDFQATLSRSMLPQPPGTHYEETNSIGKRATPILLDAYEDILLE